MARIAWAVRPRAGPTGCRGSRRPDKAGRWEAEGCVRVLMNCRTTLMRNGRDRQSGKTVKTRKERLLLVGTRSADHIWASSHSGCTQRPDTLLHPNASRKRQIPLASRAPSIHGIKRPIDCTGPYEHTIASSALPVISATCRCPAARRALLPLAWQAGRRQFGSDRGCPQQRRKRET